MRMILTLVVLYLFSTSNHNLCCLSISAMRLSYTFFLHQTTTRCSSASRRARLSYTFFLHQTTTCSQQSKQPMRCLIPFFYIKPQQRPCEREREQVVLYLFSTSNHNVRSRWRLVGWLSYTFFLHQTTTIVPGNRFIRRCLIPFSYIKPQHIFSILLIYRYLHYFASI